MDSTLEDDYAQCLKLARTHYENFPVASLFLPKALRIHVAAVYAFARTADDFADEEPNPQRRLKLLKDWRGGLKRALRASPTLSLPSFDGLRTVSKVEPLPHEGEGVLRALAASVRGGFVPKQELFRLLDAFEHDARERGYGNLRELKAYCRNSACSIGRILLHLFSVRDRRAVAASDALCAALQMTNFWQDFSRDLPRGRLTLPRSEARRFGVSLTSSRIRGDEKFRRLLDFLVRRTQDLFQKSEGFPSLVPPSLARQVKMTLAGGRLVLERVQDLGPRALETRPSLTWRDSPFLLFRAFL